MESIEVQSIAKDCSGNNKDENGRALDPITMETLPKDVITLVKVGNLCYNRETLREYLLSKDPDVGMNLDSGDSVEYSQGASGIIRDPFTNIPFTDYQLKRFHELVSLDRSRAASPAAMNLNVNVLMDKQMTKNDRKGGRSKRSRRSRRSKRSKRSRRTQRSKRSRRTQRSNKKRK
jgi:hypothetical protein